MSLNKRNHSIEPKYCKKGFISLAPAKSPKNVLNISAILANINKNIELIWKIKVLTEFFKLKPKICKNIKLF